MQDWSQSIASCSCRIGMFGVIRQCDDKQRAPMRSQKLMGVQLSAIVALLVGCFIATAAMGAWLEDGGPVVSAEGYQGQIASSRLSSGDVALVTVHTPLLGGPIRVIGQRVNSNGDLLWGAGGVLLTTTTYDVYQIIPDSQDGFTLFVGQSMLHVNANGTKTYERGVSYQRGGAVGLEDDSILFVWAEYGSSGTPSRIWADRIGISGDSLWPSPLQIVNTTSQLRTCLVAPGISGRAVLGIAYDNGTLASACVAADRQILWQRTFPAGIGGAGALSGIASDGSGGAFLACKVASDATSASWGQRITASGELPWPGNGVLLQAPAYPRNSSFPQVCLVAPGRAMYFTSDTASTPNTSRCVVVDTLGTVIRINERVNDSQFRSVDCVVRPVSGGILQLFDDTNRVVGLLFDADGNNLWNDPLGVHLTNTQESATRSFDCVQLPGGDFAISWSSPVNSSLRAFVTRRGVDGYYANPAAAVTGVSDVAADEGGYVDLDIQASRLDAARGVYSVTSYSIWRSRVAAQCGLSTAAIASRVMFPTAGAADNDQAGAATAVTPPLCELTDGTWELVGTLPAMRHSTYRVLVPTFADSTGPSPNDAYFCVYAHTSDPAVFFASGTAFGHSVDNLAPAAPSGLQYSVLPTGYRLSWIPGTEPDLTGYRLYGGASVDFSLSPESLLVSPASANFDLSGVAAAGITHCRVTAVDRHGNESPASGAIELSSMKIRIADVPGDQGGVLRASWQRHALDSSASPSLITRYEVQRHAGTWQVVGIVAAAQADSYTVDVSTPDILTIGQPMPTSRYRVVAVGSAPGVMYDSLADSACSVDDLPPAAPQLILSDTESSRILAWISDTVSDVRETCLYRGMTPGFEALMPVACSGALPYYIETDLNRYYYRARTSDIHGNLGEWSQELVGRWPTGVPGETPARLRLYPCSPNPFNPRTTIRYDLPEAGAVKLAVFDLAGRLVETLVDEIRQPGSFATVWDGCDSTGKQVSSGTYLARLDFGGKVEVVRMGLVR